jgi:HAD superfamily hydrolase (TIGR01549 family)
MLYIFDLDRTLVEMYGVQPLPGVVQRLTDLVSQGQSLAVATNQAGLAWRVATDDPKYPSPARLGRRLSDVAQALPMLASVPWYVAIGDVRLSLQADQYRALIADLRDSASTLDIHVSADRTWRKPEPGMLAAACARYGIVPGHEQVVFVGDADTDADAAAAIDVDFVYADVFFAGA